MRLPAPAAITAGLGLVARNRRLRRIAGVWGLWIAGEWSVLVLLSVSAYDRGGTTAVAVVAAMRTLPSAVTGPIVSVLADRRPRGQVLVAVLASWAVLVACVPAALTAHSLAPLYVVVALAAVTSTVLRPAINGLVPQVVDRPDELAAANSTYSILEAAGSLVGPLLAGGLLAVLPETPSYLVVAAVFALTAVLAAAIHTDFQPADHAGRAGWRTLLEPLAGFPALTGTPQLRSLFVVFVMQTITRGFFNVFVVSIAVSLLHQSVTSTGVLFSALGAGGLVGAVLTLAGSRWEPALPFVSGMAMWGVPLLLIAAAPHAPVVYAAIAGIGIGNAIADVFGLTLLHRLLPDHLLGRAFGAFWATGAGAQAVGAALAAPLISLLDLRGALVAVGVVMAVLPVAVWPVLRTVRDDLAVDAGRVDELRRCRILAPLTRLALEQLARAAEPVHVRAGSRVVDQGAVGDTFFVIVTGELSAAVDGTAVHRMVAGDCFGEIAALNRSPRTASVTADTDCDLLSLSGPTFVLAVTGHRPASIAATELKTERLSRRGR
jgi:MFS family permease